MTLLNEVKDLCYFPNGMGERRGAASKKESLRCRKRSFWWRGHSAWSLPWLEGCEPEGQGLIGLKLHFHFPYPLLSGAVRVQLRLVAELARSCPLVTIHPPLGLNAGWRS